MPAGHPPVRPTFKQRTDFSPASNASFAGVLAQGNLQEEDRNTTGEKEDQVGDEECTWEEVKKKGLLMILYCMLNNNNNK